MYSRYHSWWLVLYTDIGTYLRSLGASDVLIQEKDTNLYDIVPRLISSGKGCFSATVAAAVAHTYDMK